MLQNVPVANAKPEDIQDLLGGALFKALYKWMLESGPVYLLPTGACRCGRSTCCPRVCVAVGLRLTKQGGLRWTACTALYKRVLESGQVCLGACVQLWGAADGWGCVDGHRPAAQRRAGAAAIKRGIITGQAAQ